MHRSFGTDGGSCCDRSDLSLSCCQVRIGACLQPTSKYSRDGNCHGKSAESSCLIDHLWKASVDISCVPQAVLPALSDVKAVLCPSQSEEEKGDEAGDLKQKTTS
jgi:hypothetical protein